MRSPPPPPIALYRVKFSGLKLVYKGRMIRDYSSSTVSSFNAERLNFNTGILSFFNYSFTHCKLIEIMASQYDHKPRRRIQVIANQFVFLIDDSWKRRQVNVQSRRLP